MENDRGGCRDGRAAAADQTIQYLVALSNEVHSTGQGAMAMGNRALKKKVIVECIIDSREFFSEIRITEATHAF